METIAAFIRNNPTAILFTVTGIALRFWVGRRRFNRRGLGGLQHFSSYGKFVIITLLERMLMGLSVVLLIAALFLFITAH